MTKPVTKTALKEKEVGKMTQAGIQNNNTVYSNNAHCMHHVYASVNAVVVTAADGVDDFANNDGDDDDGSWLW